MLLDDIITTLSDSNGSIEAALLKMKILLRQLGHKELVIWVNNELTGYTDDFEVPDYRNVHTTPHGSVILHGWHYKDTLLPTINIDEALAKNVSTLHISSSIGTIEEQVKVYRTKGQCLVRQLSPEYSVYLAKGLSTGAVITSAWCEINMSEVEGIAVKVRSRLLDFCLDLKDSVGDVADSEVPAKAAAAHFDTPKVFNTIVNGGTAVIGASSVQVNNQLGDLEGLLKEVAKLGYHQSDLDELRKAVKEDKAVGKTPSMTEGGTHTAQSSAQDSRRATRRRASRRVLNARTDVVVCKETRQSPFFCFGPKRLCRKMSHLWRKMRAGRRRPTR